MLTEKLCSGKFLDAANLWTLQLTIEIRCIQNKTPSPSKAGLLYIFELLKNILMKLSVSEAEELWIMGLKKYFANQRHYFDKLVEMSVLLLARDGGNDSGFSLSSTILNDILQKDGIESARKMYKRLVSVVIWRRPNFEIIMYPYCPHITKPKVRDFSLPFKSGITIFGVPMLDQVLELLLLLTL